MLSYWEQQSLFGQADVTIIGAGLVGLTAAIYLKERRPAWRIVVLERGALPSGASTKNAGFACFGSVSELIEQEKRGDLQTVVAARYEGLQRLRGLLGDAALAYQPEGGYEIFRAAEAGLAAECRAKIDYYNDLLAPIIEQPRIFQDATVEARQFGFRGVDTILKNNAEGSLDAGRMMRTLLARTWAADVPVLSSCGVTNLESVAGATLLHLDNGAFIKADQVLLATNAFAPELRPELAVTPGRGQVLVTEPLPELRLPGTFHYDLGYTYFRQLPDQRILLGGGRNLDFQAEATTTPGLTDRVQQHLENLLHEVIVPGQRPRIDYRWSGVMGFGPALEPVLDWAAPGVLAAVRCNGMGVALGAGLGWRAAQRLAG
ncbi:FAD-binding oxidoreductase [Hymenobacter sp. ASUV-10]|uniref:FAD-binding oxidoreductase n=1 Tax=Hymenobacter aranciens TaxID=3063996 RepID=A0ABT9BAK3_9BACT|nr:FAD-binding oxidoreductase [Hymenobacter sp. ASUV-10]MDO7875301.1 FAD-binding oxidoreductase [Hymenobacter sp. ASUV-10]